MAGFFQAFATGAATTITESIKREEKNARELAAAQASALIENHNKVKDARDKQANKMIEDAKFLQAQFPTVSNDELVMAATNPSAIAALRARAAQPDWDPTVLKFSDFAQVTTKATGYGIDKIVNDMYDMSAATAAPAEANKSMSLIQRITAGTGEEALNKIVSPFGLSAEQMRGQVNFKPKMPEGEVKFNLGVLTQKTFDAEYDKVKLEVVKVQQLPAGAEKDAALKASTQKLAQFTLVKSLASTEALTNEKILSNMVTEIQELSPDSPERKALEKKLVERKALMKTGTNEINENDIRTDLTTRIIAAKKANNMPEAKVLTAELEQRKKLLDKEETNVEKITATNLQVAASRAIVAALTTYVPAGDINITTNADGSQTTSIKSISLTADYDKGVNAGRQAVFAKYTKNGVPISEAHALALLSIGFVIDEKSGIARLPANPRAGTPSPAPLAAPVATPTSAASAAPPQKLPTPEQFAAKWATLKSGQSMIGPDGKTHTKK
jgi:hypothetical protein